MQEKTDNMFRNFRSDLWLKFQTDMFLQWCRWLHQTLSVEDIGCEIGRSLLAWHFQLDQIEQPCQRSAWDWNQTVKGIERQHHGNRRLAWPPHNSETIRPLTPMSMDAPAWSALTTRLPWPWTEPIPVEPTPAFDKVSAKCADECRWGNLSRWNQCRRAQLRHMDMGVDFCLAAFMVLLCICDVDVLENI